METLLLILVAIAGCSMFGYAVAVNGRKELGATLGFFLGPLGVLVAVLLRTDSISDGSSTPPEAKPHAETTKTKRDPPAPPPWPATM